MDDREAYSLWEGHAHPGSTNLQKVHYHLQYEEEANQLAYALVSAPNLLTLSIQCIVSGVCITVVPCFALLCQ